MLVEQAGGGSTAGHSAWPVFRRNTARVAGAVPPPVLVLLGSISLQVGAAFAKEMFSIAGPAGVVTLRLVFAALILLVVWRPSVRLGRRAWATVVCYGIVLAGMNMCIYRAFEHIPLGVAVTIEFLGPLAVALFGSRRKLDVLWALLAGAGVFLLSRAEGGLNWTGVAFALTAALLWAGYILLGARLGSQTSGGSGLALAMAVGTAVAAPFGVVEAGPALLDPKVLAAGLVVALMSSVIPYSLELEALRRIPPRVFGVLMSLEPAIAALAGLVVLGEMLGLAQWLAVGCVVVASVGSTRTSTGG
ncbi:EamA family transporter [Saccharopolyspora rectivirgula]|uniref:EamA family transporter n=1 Tax=Saccharopolyspora rectivirgula TaxID=28042 RepID=UPI003C6EA2BB